MASSGLPYRVTSAQRQPRFPGDTSYHIIGQACDFAGLNPWNKHEVSAPLKAIWDFWMAKAGSLSELIYSGAPFYISKGKVRPISQLDSDLREAHWNHVHVAVPKGWHFTPEVHVPEIDPLNPDINDEGNHIVAVSISAVADAQGNMTGYVILGKDGGVFAFGPGAKYYGRVH